MSLPQLPFYHLPKLDRTMMRSTVELRTPYLSPQVIAHALEIPYEKRNGEKKELKETFGHLVPKEILKRNKFFFKYCSSVFLSNALFFPLSLCSLRV